MISVKIAHGDQQSYSRSSLIITGQLNNSCMVFTAKNLELFLRFSSSLLALDCKEVYIKQSFIQVSFTFNWKFVILRK